MYDLLPKSNKAKKSPFEKFPDALETCFRSGWTDNADAMSYLYTGTPALKTDFTRTGKRTYLGGINDGINSVTRYYINNFTDGFYHDCLDISTLKLTPNHKIRERKWLPPLKLSILLIITMTVVSKFMVETFVLQPSSKQ